jgi:probable rRNA maturation factor
MPSKHRDPGIQVAVQFAADRSGVPHASSLARWAHAAYDAARAHSPRGLAAELTIRVVGAAESRRLNRTWRQKDKPTNVLSFPVERLASVTRTASAGGAYSPGPGAAVLGDLAICAPVVAREARDQGKTAQAHWAHMVIHGVLHLLGYDHENDRDARRMESLEARILGELGYPDPYLQDAEARQL